MIMDIIGRETGFANWGAICRGEDLPRCGHPGSLHDMDFIRYGGDDQRDRMAWLKLILREKRGKALRASEIVIEKTYVKKAYEEP